MKKNIKKAELVKMIAEKLPSDNTPHGSSPSFGTQNWLNFEDFTLVWQQPVAPKIPRYPFKYARLVHHEFDLSKRWYVIYYAWNVATEKLERVRIFEPLNRIKSVQQRIYTGEQMVRIINGKLDAGKVLGKDQLHTVATTNVSELTLLSAIDYVREQKEANGNRKHYTRTYQTTKTNLKAWLDHEAQPDYNIKQFTGQDARRFFMYLRDEKKLSNKSINNIRGNLSIAFKFLQKDKQLWKKNPMETIDSLPVVAHKHAAFSDDQIKIIKTEINKTDTPRHRQLQLFISFIYYLFVRPNEAAQLRVGDFQLSENRVLVRGEVSKTKFDEYVEIPLAVRQALEKENILSYPPDYFVFGHEGQPGETHVSAHTFWKIHREVLKNCGLKKLNDHYTLYSYKHSGVISLYKATKDIKRVQRQCRHKTLEQTNTYLRDLGVLTNYDQLQGWHGAV